MLILILTRILRVLWGGVKGDFEEIRGDRKDLGADLEFSPKVTQYKIVRSTTTKLMLTSVTRGRIGVIVGLDPAAPLFSIDSNDRLDQTDANHVQMIATDTEFLGFLQPLGHSTFYVNWGSRQPGCEGEIAGICSHQMVAHFMVQSINPANIFGATRCRDFNDIVTRNCVADGPSGRMADEPIAAAQNAPGIYFLTTDPNPPFAHGPR